MASITKSPNHQITKSTSVFLEIAWRWFFLAFAAAVIAGGALAVEDAARLRPHDVAMFRSGNLYGMAATLAGLLRQYRLALESSLAVVAATLGGFWVLAGAMIRAASRRQFLRLLVLRTAALAAGAFALLACLVLIVEAGLASGFSFLAASVIVWGVLLYCCWRWIGLLLLVLERGPTSDLKTWTSVVPRLAPITAAYSTLKWLAWAGLTLVLAPLAAVSAMLHPAWPLLVAVVWVVGLTCVSGYFAARLRNRAGRTG